MLWPEVCLVNKTMELFLFEGNEQPDWANSQTCTYVCAVYFLGLSKHNKLSNTVFMSF